MTSDFNWGDYIVNEQWEAMQTLCTPKRNACSAPPNLKLITSKTFCRPRRAFAVEVWDPGTDK